MIPKCNGLVAAGVGRSSNPTEPTYSLGVPKQFRLGSRFGDKPGGYIVHTETHTDRMISRRTVNIAPTKLEHASVSECII